MNREKILVGIINLIIATIIPAAVGIVVLPILYKQLGELLFGYYSLIILLIGYFGVLDLGIAKSLTYNISKNLERKSNLLSSGIIISFLLGVLLIIICLIINMFTTKLNIFEIEKNIQMLFYIVTFSIPVVILNGVLRGALEGLSRFNKVAFVKCINGVTIFVVPLIGYNLTQDELGLAFGLIISRLIPFFILFIMCYKEFFKYTKIFDIKKRETKEIISFGRWYIVIVLLDFFLVYFDKILISFQYGVEILGSVSLINEITSKLPIMIGIILSVYFPILCNIKCKHKMKTLFKKFMIITLIIYIFIGFCILFFSFEILEIWITSQFSKENNTLFLILVIGFCLNSISRIPLNFLLALGKSKKITRIHFFETLIYVPVMIFVSQVYNIEYLIIVWLIRNILDLTLLTYAYEKEIRI